MSCRRPAVVLLATLLACLVHPCLAQDRRHSDESASQPARAAHHGAALEPTGCEPDATTPAASPTPSGGPAGTLVTAADAPPGSPAGRGVSGRPPAPVPRPPLFLLHAALLA